MVNGRTAAVAIAMAWVLNACLEDPAEPPARASAPPEPPPAAATAADEADPGPLRDRVDALEIEVADAETEIDEHREALASAAARLAECSGEAQIALDEPADGLILDPVDLDDARALRQRIARLEDYARRLEVERDRYRAAAERTEKAARRCATEQAREEDVPAPVRAAAPPERQRETPFDNAFRLHDPQVEVRLNGAVDVRGRIRNSVGRDYLIYVNIELLRDGVVIESSEREVDVPGMSDVQVSETFYPERGTGRYTARFSWR